MYVDGINLRRIARHLGVNHQSVANWANADAKKLPAAPVPDQVEKAEMDDLFTFIGDKKNNLHYHDCRSPNALHFRLGGCLGAHPGSHPTHGG
jgi:hypothetical protein